MADLSKRIQSFAILVILFSCLAMVLTSMPVKAQGTYDGIYDFHYTLWNGHAWVEYTITRGFIVEDGQIRSEPRALSGSVGANGYAYFRGLCPYDRYYTATYTGYIKSDGSGSGTYQCPYGHRGSWSVTIVERPFSFSSITPLIAVGAVVGAVGLAIRSARKKRPVISRKMGTTQFSTYAPPSQVSKAAPPHGARPPPAPPYRAYTHWEVSPPAPPTTIHEIPPSPIQPPPPPKAPEAGVHVGPPPLPDALNLRANWDGGQVTLNWDTPQFDPSMYRLDGYNVSIMQYEPTSTAPVKIQIAQLPPGQNQWAQPFTQTYRWNTGGDIQGYTVEAVFRHTSSTGYVETYRVGATAYAPR